MDDEQPQSSFYASRAQIEQVNVSEGESVIMQFRQPEDRDWLKTWFSNAGSGRASGGISREDYQHVGDSLARARSTT
jgi:hypothetical protein